MDINSRTQYRVVPYGGSHKPSYWYDPEFAERAAKRALADGSRYVQIIEITERMILELNPESAKEEAASLKS